MRDSGMPISGNIVTDVEEELRAAAMEIGLYVSNGVWVTLIDGGYEITLEGDTQRAEVFTDRHEAALRACVVSSHGWAGRMCPACRHGDHQGHQLVVMDHEPCRCPLHGPPLS